MEKWEKEEGEGGSSKWWENGVEWERDGGGRSGKLYWRRGEERRGKVCVCERGREGEGEWGGRGVSEENSGITKVYEIIHHKNSVYYVSKCPQHPHTYFTSLLRDAFFFLM